MRILFDTSALIDIDKKKDKALPELMEELTDKNVELVISTVSISEFLTGVYLKSEVTKYSIKAKEFLMQFKWFDLDAETAEETAKLIAHRLLEGKPIEYQDNVISATFKTAKADFLITTDIKHFDLPTLKGNVFTPSVFFRKLKEGKLSFI